MIKSLIKFACLAFCLVMTWWLVRYEAFPVFFADSFAGYRSLMSGSTLLVDSWTKIMFKGVPIGYSHTQFASSDESEEEATRLENRTVLKMKVLGSTQNITATASAALDRGQQLRKFNFVLKSDQYRVQIEGARETGNTFNIFIHTAAGVSTSQIDIPDDVIVYSPLTEMALRRLKPGQRLRIKTLDPISLRLVDVVCESVRREIILKDGKEVSVTLLAIAYQGMSVRTWMNDQGRIVRQETPLGWVMESSTQKEALALRLDTSAMDDMILANTVPLTGEVTHPQQCRSLTLLLEGLHLAPEGLNSPRQDVEVVSETEANVTLYAKGLPESSTPIGDLPPGMDPYLAATPYVQANHQDIINHATKLVGDTTDSLEAAMRIYHWVSRKIEKSAIVSLPSALDVLKQRVGDCNEHTYLFVALARSIGLPAQIRIGLVLNKNAFYYHAWPSVYVGEWVEMDPTLLQPTVDATHLALLEGELDKQLELMKVIGHLRANVVEVSYEEGDK